MGLDVGTKTIGLALSDTRRVIATPLETIRRRRFREDMARLSALIDAHGVAGLVIGLPLTLAGTDGPHHNVIKLRPPLIFTEADADRCVTTLDAILGEDPAQPRR